MLKKSIFTIVLILLLPLAQALFAIEAEEYEKTVCIGSTEVIADKITGDQADYTVKASGEVYPFITIVPEKFSITGISQNIYAYISPNSKTVPGNYFINMVIKDSKGNEKEQVHRLIVKDCHKASLEIEPEKKSCPCEKSYYNLILDNLGDFEETFSISVEGIPEEWLNLSINEIRLKSGEIAKINATINPPCNVYGQYKLKFNAITSSYAKTSGVSVLNIIPCYEYELKLPSQIVLCENDQSEILVKLENKGTADNSFKLNLDGPEWMKLNEKEVILAKSGERILNISASPPMKTKGTFDLKLSVLSSIGDVKKESLSKVEIKKCYDSSLEPELKEDNLCKKEKKYQIKLNNNGEFSMEYDLKIDGPEWVYTNTNKLEIPANKTRTFELRTDPKDAAYGEYDIKISAIDSENNKISSNITLTIPLPTECYQLNITSEKNEIIVGKEKAKTALILIKNKGMEEGSYLLSLIGEGAEFSMLNPNIITIKPREAESLYVYTAAPLYAELKGYNLTIIATEETSKVQFSKELVIKVSEETEETKSNLGTGKLAGLIEKIKSVFIAPKQKPQLSPIQNVSNKTENKNLSINFSEELNKEPIDNIRDELNQVNIGSINSFIVENKSYVMAAGAIILIAFLILTGLWKPIIEFFEEEVVVEEKSGKRK